jgi:hypothetical protein
MVSYRATAQAISNRTGSRPDQTAPCGSRTTADSLGRITTGKSVTTSPGLGPPGTLVTVTGSGFSAGEIVLVTFQPRPGVTDIGPDVQGDGCNRRHVLMCWSRPSKHGTHCPWGAHNRGKGQNLACGSQNAVSLDDLNVKPGLIAFHTQPPRPSGNDQPAPSACSWHWMRLTVLGAFALTRTGYGSAHADCGLF